MHRAAFVLLVLPLAGCLGGTEAPEEIPVGRIDGAVLNHLLQPYGSTRVHLVELDRWTETTPRGGFSFVNVPTGFHILETTIEGIGTDRELVSVSANEVTKIILQVWAEPETLPYVTELMNTGRQQVAEPGLECEPCSWRAHVDTSDMPTIVEARAVWTDANIAPDYPTRLTMFVEDNHGNLLVPPEDVVESTSGNQRELYAVVRGEDIPADAGSLQLRFVYHPDNMPHVDFRMESFLDIHHGMTERAAKVLG